jgi:hypothetical protein
MGEAQAKIKHPPQRFSHRHHRFKAIVWLIALDVITAPSAKS